MHCTRRLKLTKRQLKSREKRRLSFKENNDKAVLGLSIGNNGAQQNGLISLKYRKKITSNLTYTSQKYLSNGKEKQRHVQENRTIETLLPKTQSEISGQQGTLMCLFYRCAVGELEPGSSGPIRKQQDFSSSYFFLTF